MARSELERSQIKALNDEMRSGGPNPTSSNKWVLTGGVLELGPEITCRIVERVRDFELFDGDNDPWGEHDFGSFEIAGERVLWKIDYYNRSLEGGSPNPMDPCVTKRVLTILLALEY